MTQPRRGRPASVSRTYIRATALSLFDKHGYEDVSLARVATACGVSRTTVFSHFAAKRDILLEEFAARQERVRIFLAGDVPEDPVDLVVSAMLVLADYGPRDHAELARRRRIVEGSDELRAYTSLSTSRLAEAIALRAAELAPPQLRGAFEDLTLALITVAARATDEWAEEAEPADELGHRVAQRIRGLVSVFREYTPLRAPQP